jgi:uncharacterized protein YcnI
MTSRPSNVRAFCHRHAKASGSKWLAGIAIVLTGLAFWAGVASAHITITPDSAPKGAGDQVITFQVPNEMDNANTIGLRVQFPTDHPIAAIDPQAIPGWTSKVTTTHLATPITTDDGTVTDVVSEVDWTGGSIPPGHFGAFPVLAMGLPKDVDSLTIKAIQSYDNGQDVSWIEDTPPGGPEPDHPAPVLKLTAAAGDNAAAGASGSNQVGVTTTAAPATTSNATTSSSSDSSKALAAIGIIVAVVALALAVVALITARTKVSAAEGSAAEDGSAADDG